MEKIGEFLKQETDFTANGLKKSSQSMGMLCCL